MVDRRLESQRFILTALKTIVAAVAYFASSHAGLHFWLAAVIKSVCCAQMGIGIGRLVVMTDPKRRKHE